MAACSDLPSEGVAVQPWTPSLHPPTSAAGLAAMDPEVQTLEEELGFGLGPEMEVRSVCLRSPMCPDLLEGLSFTEVCTAVHGQLPSSRDASLRPLGCDLLVEVQWSLWAANSLGPGPR